MVRSSQGSLNEGLLSREQRQEALGAPPGLLFVAASTKGCSRESSDRRGRWSRPRHREASTKGCSRESSDFGEAVRGGVVLYASTKGCSRESSDCRRARDRPCRVLRPPQRRAALARAATGNLERRRSRGRDDASTKGCSRESSDVATDDDSTVNSNGPPQRRAALARAATSSKACLLTSSLGRPQRRAALARAATNSSRRG